MEEVTIDPNCLEDVILRALQTHFGPSETVKGPRAEFYSKFQTEIDGHDHDPASTYSKDLDTTLIFAGLFSAVASAFIVNVQSQLQPDYSRVNHAILTIMANTTVGRIPTDQDLVIPRWIDPGPTLVHVQAILFSSLAVSLLAAFIAMLGKQWLNRYFRDGMYGSLIDRGRDRRRKMVKHTWFFNFFMGSPPLMLQAALLLLGCALSGYLFNINDTVARTIAGFTAFSALLYTLIALAAFISYHCPFQTTPSPTCFITNLDDAHWKYFWWLQRPFSQIKDSWKSSTYFSHVTRMFKRSTREKINFAVKEFIAKVTLRRSITMASSKIHHDTPFRLADFSLSLHPHEITNARSTQHGDFNLAASPSPHRELLPPEADPLFPIEPIMCLDRIVDSLKPFLLYGCKMFGVDDLKVVGSHPVDSGGSADIWVCSTSDGYRVALKSYRCYSDSNLPQACLRFHREAIVCDLLDGIRSENFMPFLGTYTCRDHPFALVFKFMDCLNLGKHLRQNQETRRVELLLQIAQGLEEMHDLGIVHGNIKPNNILVDKECRARIGGLGRAYVQSTTSTPEVAHLQRSGLPDPRASKTNDLYAFGTLAWEIFAGPTLLLEESVTTRVHSMPSHRRPTRPTHPELSERLWRLIKECWDTSPGGRPTIAEVVAILEAEVNTKSGAPLHPPEHS